MPRVEVNLSITPLVSEQGHWCPTCRATSAERHTLALTVADPTGVITITGCRTCGWTDD